MSVQQTIIAGIKEQLFYHDYLVLPNFGGFVLKSSAAHFSASGTSLAPPSKIVSFNSQLRQNDGILAVWLQKQMNCGATEALGHLREFAEYCSSLLNTKRRLSLEGIGFFYLDFENNICFEPQHDSNFLSSSFGLGPVSVMPLQAESKEIKKETVFIDRSPANREVVQKEEVARKVVPVRSAIKKIANYSFAAFVVVSLLLLLVANSKINGELRSSIFGGQDLNTYVPVSYPELSLNVAASSAKAYVADANGFAVVELGPGKSITVKAATALSKSPESDKFELNRYHVVLGCFSVFKNAKRYLSKLSSEKIQARISGQNAKGMYVVSLGDYSSRGEAVSKLADMKSSFPGAWIKQGE